jgi:hypothetical protein
MSVMRYLLLLLILLLAASSAEAQRIPTPVLRDSLPALQPVPDTAAAIHRLFAAKRKRQVIVGGTTFGVAVGAVVATSNQQPSGGGGGGFGILTNTGPILDGPGMAVLAVGVIMFPVVLLEAVIFGGWSKKQEQLTIDGWQQHKESQFLKRRLKSKYFAAPPPTD